MMMDHVQHYPDAAFTASETRLGDHEYGRALDCIVKAVTDVIFTTSDGRVLLSHRRVHPNKGLWYFGGRMQTGETPLQAMSRRMERETGLRLAPGRFSLLRVVSYTWGLREQAPQEHGTCDLALVYTACLSPAEVAAMKLDRGEYSGDVGRGGGEARSVDEWLALPAGALHPSLVDSMRLLQREGLAT